MVLADVAWVMRQEIGERGTVCRYGGEEFAVILPGRDRIDAARTAEALRRAVEEHEVDPSAPGGVPPRVSVTVSLGVAAVEPRTSRVLSTPVLLTRRADQALYAAKTAGRNCVRVFHVTDEGKSAA